MELSVNALTGDMSPMQVPNVRLYRRSLLNGETQWCLRCGKFSFQCGCRDPLLAFDLYVPGRDYE